MSACIFLGKFDGACVTEVKVGGRHIKMGTGKNIKGRDKGIEEIYVYE